MRTTSLWAPCSGGCGSGEEEISDEAEPQRKAGGLEDQTSAVWFWGEELWLEALGLEERGLREL